MKQKILTIVTALCCALLLGAVPGIASSKSGNEAKKAPARADHQMWSPVTFSGTISMVDPAERLVVVRDSTGVPFDVVVTHATRIRSGDQKLTLPELAAQTDKAVSVTLIPEKRGDMGKMIQVRG